MTHRQTCISPRLVDCENCGMNGQSPFVSSMHHWWEGTVQLVVKTLHLLQALMTVVVPSPAATSAHTHAYIFPHVNNINLIIPFTLSYTDQSDWWGGSSQSHLQTMHGSLWTCSLATRGGTRSTGCTVGSRHADRASTWQQSMLEASPRATKAHLGSSSGDWYWSLCWRGIGHCRRLLPMEGATTPAGLA